MRRVLRVVVLLPFWMALPRAGADAGWLLTLDDLRPGPVALQGIDGRGVRVVPLGAAQAITIPMDSFVQIDRATRARTAAGSFSLVLANGDRYTGQPLGMKDEQVAWRSSAVGELKIPLKEIRALIRAGSSIENLDQPPREDKILLANGDSVKGIVTGMSEMKVTIGASSALEIPLATVQWIHFAPAGKTVGKTERAFRVWLNDDSLITASSVEADEQTMRLSLADGSKREVPLGSAAGVEQLNGPVSWLSSRTPRSVAQIPYFGGVTWPTRMDSTVGGRPIQFGERVYACGIGVHAYSRIEFDLDGRYEGFRTQYAIAQEEKRQYADVTVRIKVDGKLVHERQSLKADVLSPVVVVDLPGGAKVLTLEVDYGQANDTQDRFNWIEPALLRRKPAATQPAAGGTLPAARGS